MGATGERIRRGLRATFGHVAWQPPQWASSAASFLHIRGAAAASAARANPRRAVMVGAGAIALVVGAALMWRWYENRPRPVEVAFTVTAPPVTCYACDPPRPPNPLIVQFACGDSAAGARWPRGGGTAGGHLDEPAARRPMDVGWRQGPALPARERLAGRPALRSVAVAQGIRRRARAPARLSLRVRFAGVRREGRDDGVLPGPGRRREQEGRRERRLHASGRSGELRATRATDDVRARQRQDRERAGRADVHRHVRQAQAERLRALRPGRGAPRRPADCTSQSHRACTRRAAATRRARSSRPTSTCRGSTA